MDDFCVPGSSDGDLRPWLRAPGEEGADNNNTCLFYPMFYVNPVDRCIVGENLRNSSFLYSLEDPWSILEGTNKTLSFMLSSVEQDTSDQRSERTHFQDSAALLLIMALLFLTIITIWVFKVKRMRVMHETGLALLYGVVVGLALRYSLPSTVPNEFLLAVEGNASSNCSEPHFVFEVGETIQINTLQDSFTCSVISKVFKDARGNFIRSTLLFDPEIFFFALLPPIIFYAGYSLNKRYFFRNLGSLLLYAFGGTTLSCFIVGALMYGYSLSGAETEGSFLANATGFPVPEQFAVSIIPSLLFGSLISATDPVTVLALFHDLHVDFDIFSLVFGESVMNDAVAIVLFRSIDEYGEGSGEFHWIGLLKSIGTFIGIFFGSFVLGVAMGLVTALLMKFSKLRDHPLLETSMFVIMSYSTFVLAEFCQLTGIVAVLFCGIMQSYYTYINLSHESRRRTKEAFELINFLAENFVFSYIGLSLFTYSNHQWAPGFILFSFLAIFAGRLVNIYVLSFLLNLGRSKKISFRFQHMLMFAGLRGAIAFALAIRNTQNEERQLIFTTTLVIVMVTVLFCGGFTTLVLQCLKIQVGVVDEEDGVIAEDGKIIPHDKKKGNWLISKWSIFDKKYLIPIFTHHGRSVDKFFHRCPQWCIPFCSKCKPEEEMLLEEGGSGEEDLSEIESDLDEVTEEDQILSFRKSEMDDDDDDDAEEGDLGLGTDADGRHGYAHLSAESTF